MPVVGQVGAASDPDCREAPGAPMRHDGALVRDGPGPEPSLASQAARATEYGVRRRGDAALDRAEPKHGSEEERIDSSPREDTAPQAGTGTPAPAKAESQTPPHSIRGSPSRQGIR